MGLSPGVSMSCSRALRQDKWLLFLLNTWLSSNKTASKLLNAYRLTFTRSILKLYLTLGEYLHLWCTYSVQWCTSVEFHE